MGKRNNLKDLKSRHAVDRRMIRDCIRNYGEFKLNEDTFNMDVEVIGKMFGNIWKNKKTM